MIIHSHSLIAFLKQCRENGLGGFSQVIIPRLSLKNSADSFLSSQFPPETYHLDGYRPVDPLRLLFYFPREQVFPAAANSGKRLIVGVKACDLKALLLLDKALMGPDFVDPNYRYWRENSIIVSSDCTAIAPTCHCTLVGGQPFATRGFDLNLTRIGDEYLLSTGSPVGEELLNLIRSQAELRSPTEEDRKRIQNQQNQMIERLQEQNRPYERTINAARLREAPLEKWLRDAKPCIGCGGCTNICPTCYCLILNDESKGTDFVKVRSTDSCQWHGYARVAGGASPRPKMVERFRNRYLCKFDYMPSNFDELGCTGCGRCTEVCAAEIDFREVLRAALSQTQADSVNN